MNTSKRNYRATFILDNRGKEDTTDTIIETVKAEITSIQGEVKSVESLGKRDFSRVTDPKFTAASYVQIEFSGTPESPAALKERLRLNQNIYRTFVEIL